MVRGGLATCITCIAPLLVACAASGSGDGDFSGAWSGSVNEFFDCQNATIDAGPGSTSGPMLTINMELDVSQSGSNVTAAIAACQGVSLMGTAGGDVVNVTGGTGGGCDQTDAEGDMITINDFSGGGTLSLDNGGLSVYLNVDATWDGDSTCTGTIIGTLDTD